MRQREAEMSRKNRAAFAAWIGAGFLFAGSVFSGVTAFAAGEMNPADADGILGLEMATASDAEVEYVDVEGDVRVVPEFTWDSADNETDEAVLPSGFTFHYVVMNRSSVLVPGTEIIFELPEDSSLFFKTANGRSREHRLEISDFAPGESREETISGIRTAEDADSAETAIRVEILLRGYGLEHRSGGRFPIPDPPAAAVVQEPEKPKEFVYSVLIANFTGGGKNPVTAEMIGKQDEVQMLLADSAAGSGSSRMHYLTAEDAVGEKRYSGIPVYLTAFLIALVFFYLANRVLNAVSIRRKERERKFRRK